MANETPSTLGLDIGGAMLKAASATGFALSRSFALWRRPERLRDELQLLTEPFGFDRLAVTMTGELCDCFATKSEGVQFILDAVHNAFGSVATWVWQTTGRFVEPAHARTDAWATAAANWLALATFVSHLTDNRSAILVDIGSTTTDVIAIRDGQPAPGGRTDSERLASDELIYQGVVRTPVCAILDRVRIAGREYRTMAELFATSLDAYLLMGDIAEDSGSVDTADGRPATRAAARDRLARMVGSDHTRFAEHNALEMARQIEARQVATIAAAIEHVVDRSLAGRLEEVIFCGQGEFLARRALDRCQRFRNVPRQSMTTRFGAEVSRAACAYAVAVLLDQFMPAT
jgi:probable H4MPT-linked C1 transfer pathway protein